MNLCLWWLAAADLCYLVTLASTSTVASFVELVDADFLKQYDAYSRLYMSGRVSTINNDTTVNDFMSIAFLHSTNTYT